MEDVESIETNRSRRKNEQYLYLVLLRLILGSMFFVFIKSIKIFDSTLLESTIDLFRG